MGRRLKTAAIQRHCCKPPATLMTYSVDRRRRAATVRSERCLSKGRVRTFSKRLYPSCTQLVFPRQPARAATDSAAAAGLRLARTVDDQRYGETATKIAKELHERRAILRVTFFEAIQEDVMTVSAAARLNFASCEISP